MRIRFRDPVSLVFASLLGALTYGCQVDSTGSKPGLIDVEDCGQCRDAYVQCLAEGNGDGTCEAMMQECFAECSVDDEQPVDCGCGEIYDACMGDDQGGGNGDQDPGDQDPGDQDPEDPADCGANDDCHPDDEGEPTDECQISGECEPPTPEEPGQKWECELIYQECAIACEEPPPPSQCQECDVLLIGCVEQAQASDDPVAVLTACIEPYVECRLRCADELPEPPPGGNGEECRQCEDALGSCFESGSDEETCFAEYEQCAAVKCDGEDGTGGGGQEPPDGDKCFVDYDECLGSCGDGTERDGCEEALDECIGQSP